ncbi:MAG: InlB B-repeat-containing protein [Eggerthellaceae bacterium]|nr:InlB B-repeat-containing protein [Eggerthellaceae bacterium]
MIDRPAPTYKLTLKADPAEGGSVSSEQAKESYPAGDTVTLTATPDEGYEFDKWESSDVTVDNNSFTMPDKPVTVTATFKKIPYKVTADDVTLGWTEKVYSGSSQVPDVTVKHSGLTLTPDEDYTVELYLNGESVGSAVDAGEYTLKITGKNAFQGEVTKTFKINPRAIAADTIEIASPVQYTGSRVTPVVKLDGKELTPGVDYDVTITDGSGVEVSEAVEAGDYMLSIKAKGNYSGDVVKTFTIEKPTPTYALSVVFGFVSLPAELQFGDQVIGVATVTNTGTGSADFSLTCGLNGDTWNYDDLEAGSSQEFQFTYDVVYADVEAGKIETFGSATALGPNGEEVAITVTDATATVVPTPTVFTIDLGEGTLDGKTGKIPIDANVGQPIQLPTGTPVRDGYTFQYYRGSEYYPGDTYIVEADHTLTAVYKKNQPTIPDTGDATPIALALALLVLSGAGLAFARKRG